MLATKRVKITRGKSGCRGLQFIKRISEAQGRLRELVVAEKRPSANERAAVPEVSVNPGRRRFQRWIFTEEKAPDMPEHRRTIRRGDKPEGQVTKRQRENSGEAGRLVRWNLPVI